LVVRDVFLKQRKDNDLKDKICPYNDDIMKKEFKIFEKCSAEKQPKDSKEELVCRICWVGEIEPDKNPLFQSCNCTGTIKHMHYECLKKWVDGNKTYESSGYVCTYNWKHFNCEICKYPFPDEFQNKDGKSYKILNYDVPKGESYIVIEDLGEDQTTVQKKRKIHVVTAFEESNTKKSFAIGRGMDSDIKVNNISASRLHASISYIGKNFVINDNRSKFGTLVLAPQKLRLTRDFPYLLQVGRTIFYIALKYYKEKEDFIAEEELEKRKNCKLEEKKEESSKFKDFMKAPFAFFHGREEPTVRDRNQEFNRDHNILRHQPELFNFHQGAASSTTNAQNEQDSDRENVIFALMLIFVFVILVLCQLA